MKEIWQNHAEFITMSNETVSVDISPDWDVSVNGEPHNRLSGHAAVILSGIIAAMDTVILTSDLYRISGEVYKGAVQNGVARPLDSMPGIVSSKGFGKFLQRIHKPVNTPFRTNVLLLQASSLKKVYCIARDTHDDEFVKGIVDATVLSEDEAVNTYFRRNLHVAYQRKKDVERVVANSRSQQQSSKDMQLYDTADVTKTTDLETADTAGGADLYQDDAEEGATEHVSMRPLIHQVDETVEYIASDAVVKSVGAYVFSADIGSKFTEKELRNMIKIHETDTGRLRNALTVLVNAGFLGIVIRETGTDYVRLDKN